MLDRPSLGLGFIPSFTVPDPPRVYGPELSGNVSLIYIVVTQADSLSFWSLLMLNIYYHYT